MLAICLLILGLVLGSCEFGLDCGAWGFPMIVFGWLVCLLLIMWFCFVFVCLVWWLGCLVLLSGAVYAV